MEIFQWLTGTEPGKCVLTMLVSMIPIIELRGGLPFGVALGLPYHLAFPAAVIGNIIPAPFIIVYIRRIFLLMRRYMPRLNGMVDSLEQKAHLKGQKVSLTKEGREGLNKVIVGLGWDEAQRSKGGLLGGPLHIRGAEGVHVLARDPIPGQLTLNGRNIPAWLLLMSGLQGIGHISQRIAIFIVSLALGTDSCIAAS